MTDKMRVAEMIREYVVELGDELGLNAGSAIFAVHVAAAMLTLKLSKPEDLTKGLLATSHFYLTLAKCHPSLLENVVHKLVKQ